MRANRTRNAFVTPRGLPSHPRDPVPQQARPPEQQIVSAEADCTCTALRPGEDEFALLACDGIWEVMDSQGACAPGRQAGLGVELAPPCWQAGASAGGGRGRATVLSPG